MIFVTGDTHSDFRKLNYDSFPEQREMTKDDYVIICGDFGGVWDKDVESPCEKFWMNWLEDRPFTTLFVDGNHENFDRLYAYPVEVWNGGKVHKIRPTVIHLMRGQVFTLEGKKFFTFGGASSHDISGGILELDDPDYHDKKKELDKGWKPYRVNHLSWWERELPTVEEMEEGRRNLAAHNNEVDFIVTHCCSASSQVVLGRGLFKNDYLTDYLEGIKQGVKYDKWFFGHYHDNRNVNHKELLFYEQIIRVV